ncbi:hypothetical protein RAS12_10140 [Achromobacter seleniivolatilans]|uniref:Uncharacterized protein n=1 Tax=Achromobacter seleniivolatilans TaxID=3047478 RepID=A0ABY9M6U8_9BURK|nr:hypothetical protein [Achromobacter sp. R39]WMD22709.1 hypothetical protein RAS12_10140 [Achromobacter sp. R39]
MSVIVAVGADVIVSVVMAVIVASVVVVGVLMSLTVVSVIMSSVVMFDHGRVVSLLVMRVPVAVAAGSAMPRRLKFVWFDRR